jgi:hypothetical protein
MKPLATLLLLVTTLTWTCEAQTCLGLKPIELPPLGHPYAAQRCVCESMNRGCRWAWVDNAQPSSPSPYVNQFDEVMRKAFEHQLREKELRQQQELIEQQQHEAEEQQREAEERQGARVKTQNDQANDLAILKAVHEGILVPVTPEDPAICNLQLTETERDRCGAKLAAQFAAYGPTIKSSSGQVYRVVAPASDQPAPPTPSTDSTQFFTQGLLNGRMWMAMSDPDRAFYVSAYLQGYMVSCLAATNDPAQQKSCYGKLGDPAHTNPVDPKEIVDGVNGVFAVPENRPLIIPVAIRAASMKVNGESQEGIDKYIQSERNAVAASPAK